MPEFKNKTSASKALDGVNFFLADVRDGLGPYLSIYLLAVKGPEQGWNEASIGLVMTIAGLCGLLTLSPIGYIIDKVNAKRALLILAALIVTTGCLFLPFVSSFFIITFTQSVTTMAAGVFAPAIAGISLGIVGPRYFTRRIGRNEAFNHAGNFFSAALAAIGAYLFGPEVVFWLMAILTIFSIISILLIPSSSIDKKAVQGIDESAGPPLEFKKILLVPSLLIFAFLMAVFHLANAAMLPTLGQYLSKLVGAEHATSLVALCTMAAQIVMIPIALLVAAKADLWGRKKFIILAFFFLTLRGFLYPLWDNVYWLFFVQLFDGVGAGILGALLPVVVADIMWGKGNYNSAQGIVAFIQGVGAALSASLAGGIVVKFGYAEAFLTLGSIALMGLIIAYFFMPETKKTNEIQ
ncbi:MFS transporter [Bartonella sp. HY406]|uniref:MFS transporter n=1 Tax=Bartonella sp. HY406 TaxID=2979331 RepID=UPI0021C8400E|nr:MFS transporter [Bartonella sp. HY406]UXN02919.1 MFS transporter [Bartonella sp. HY406]